MQDGPVYYSIPKPLTVSLKIKRSEFICTLAPVKDLEQAKHLISRISKENRSATHNCWAYIVGDQGALFHSSDAGEPAGTAGKPMLNALRHHKLTNVAAVVTRYYGGIKLGVKGLIDAYSAAVNKAVSKARLVRHQRMVCVSVQVAYDYNDILLNLLKQHTAMIRDTTYTQAVSHTIDIGEVEWKKVSVLFEQLKSMGYLTYEVLEN